MKTYSPADDAALDRWHDGALDACNFKKAASEDADYMEGYRQGQQDRKVRAVMPERPEGYYHSPIGMFD